MWERPVQSAALAERARRLAGASMFIGVVPAIALVTTFPDGPFWANGLSVISVLLCVWLWIRLPSTGVEIHGDHIVVTSWWIRRRYAREGISRFRAEPYTGPFFILGWTVYGGSLESGIVVVQTTAGATAPLHGTVCNRRTARRIAERLNQWLGVDVGSGTGARRTRRAAELRAVEERDDDKS